MADLLNDIVAKIDKSEFETKDEYKELLKKEKKRIEKLSFFAECKDKIEGFPKDDIVYVMNVIGLVNQFNKECGCERNFTVDDAKKALRVIYDTYGRDMAIIVEKMYRDETTHFTSKQYAKCGAEGMESFGQAPYYGWDKDLFTNLPICTWSAFEGKGGSEQGGNKQVTDRKKNFIVFDNVLDAMMIKVNYINKYNGDFARWHAKADVNKKAHDWYQEYMKKMKYDFVKEFDGGKK